jgi:alkylhydroperoxidase/carboxymuconolactone decarboxylase family protein YurZ
MAAETTLTQLAALVGTLSPFLTAIVQNPKWSSAQRSWIALAISVALGAATAVGANQFAGLGLTPLGILSSIAIVAASAQASFMLMKNTGVITKLELKTTRKDGRYEYTG